MKQTNSCSQSTSCRVHLAKCQLSRQGNNRDSLSVRQRESNAGASRERLISY